MQTVLMIGYSEDDPDVRLQKLLRFVTDTATETSESSSAADRYTLDHLSPLTHYQLSVCFATALEKHVETKKIKSDHVKAAVNLLDRLDYDDDLAMMISQQSALISTIASAASVSKRDWQQMRRDRRIGHLNRIVAVTDYMMQQAYPDLVYPERTTPVVRDEKDVPSTARHKKGAFDAGAYYGTCSRTITLAYNHNTNSLADQALVYEYLKHEMAHRLDGQVNTLQSNKDMQERFTNPDSAEIKYVSSTINHLFSQNIKRITGNKATRKQAVLDVYHADIAERMAYDGNATFTDIYEHATVDDYHDLKDQLGDCPPDHAWLHTAIDDKLDKFRVVGGLDPDEPDKIAGCEDLYQMIKTIGALDTMKANGDHFVEYLYRRVTRPVLPVERLSYREP